MYYSDENEYYSDDSNELEDIPDDILYEREIDKKIKIVNEFKNSIYYETEFVGIKNLSVVDLLCIIEKYKNCEFSNVKIKLNLSKEQIILFDKLYLNLFDELKEIEYYEIITNKIFRKIYV